MLAWFAFSLFMYTKDASKRERERRARRASGLSLKSQKRWLLEPPLIDGRWAGLCMNHRRRERARVSCELTAMVRVVVVDSGR